MTNAADARFEAALAASFRRAGMSDVATFKAFGLAAVPNCDVYIDRGVQLIGDQTQVSNNHVTLTCYPAQTDKQPARGDTFTIGSEVFVIDSLLEQDESAAVFIVTEKAP